MNELFVELEKRLLNRHNNTNEFPVHKVETTFE